MLGALVLVSLPLPVGGVPGGVGDGLVVLALLVCGGHFGEGGGGGKGRLRRTRSEAWKRRERVLEPGCKACAAKMRCSELEDDSPPDRAPASVPPASAPPAPVVIMLLSVLGPPPAPPSALRPCPSRPISRLPLVPPSRHGRPHVLLRRRQQLPGPRCHRRGRVRHRLVRPFPPSPPLAC